MIAEAVRSAVPGQDPKRPNLSSGKLKAHQSMHMSLAGTNLSNEQPETGRVIALSGHAARRCGRQVCSIRFMVPMHAEKRKGALHEPPPHPFPLPIPWGEGGRRSGEGRFMVPMHAEKRKGAFHEPTHPWPLPGGELGKRARHWLPSSGGVGGGFMASIHVRILEVFPTH